MIKNIRQSRAGERAFRKSGENNFARYFDLDLTLLSSRMSDYPTITQGKTRIPGINDGEEFELTDVSQ
jgi:hypothetical protein